jgi:diacylglycerol kinase family enzyme
MENNNSVGTVLIRTVLIVINPISGDVDKEDLESRIETFCIPCFIRPIFYKTSGEEDLKELRKMIAEKKPDAVFAAGGDGTVNLVAEALNHTPTPLGILPLGSGNGLSKDLGIPQDPDEALDLMRHHQIKGIDTLDLNGHCSFHLSDLGFNALVVKKFSEGETRGPGAYAWIAMQEYLSYEPRRFKIVTDTENFEGPAFMLTIANANTFGSNAAINPGGIIDDGMFEICLIEPFPKAAGLGILYKLYTDSINESVYTQRIRCREATIYNPENEVAHVDGEPKDLGTEIKVKIHPRSLNVILPPGQ